MLRRLSCLFAACAVLIFISVPAFATGMEMAGGIPVIGEVQLDVVKFADFACKGATWFYNAISHSLGSDACAYAPTLGGRHKFSPVRTLVNGQIGLYYQCEYCGRNYGDALDEAYQGYVSLLPSTQYNSDGSFLWRLGLDDFVDSSHNPVSTVSFWLSRGSERTVQSFRLDGSSRFYSSWFGVSAWAVPSEALCIGFGNGTVSSSLTGVYIGDGLSCFAPLDGYYTCSDSAFYNASSGAYAAGSFLTFGRSSTFACQDFVTVKWPAFWVTPFSPPSDYVVNTRVSGAALNGGMFGYMQNGQLCQSSVGTIYNETSNIYQNPVTGDTANISNWEYDYSNRSYTLTTDESETVTVTYGDNSVTINEGGTVYNVYYLLSEPQTVREDTSHTHSYSSAVTTPPTCTGAGVRTLTCTECGWQVTEAVPATGHSYSASVVTLEPTCAAPGVRTGTCTICGDEATEPIPALGHDYSSAVTLAPSCVASGVRTFACSRCGDAYTESIPATGHVWQATLSVPTQYDDTTGELVQAGFTLYRCSNCGEEYRIDAASGGSSLPAASGGGASTGGGVAGLDPDVGKGLLPTIAQGIEQDLPGVLQASSGWFAFFPGYYSGWVKFLRDGIACLPSEAQAMISFGFGVIAFLGLLLRLAGRR